MLEKILKSKAETKVLGVVLFSDGLHLREIARRAGVSPYEAKRELDNLLGIGVLEKKPIGGQVHFYLKSACPFITELKGLYMKTDGIFAIIKKHLFKLGLKYAVVYGSTAKGEFQEKSDVDLLLIGDVDEFELDAIMLKIQKETGREVNYILWKESELRKKIKEKGAFINSVIKNPKIMIIGDEHEFVRPRKKR